MVGGGRAPSPGSGFRQAARTPPERLNFAALRMLVPGVRLTGGAVHDQKRVVTPAQAVAAGARYLVVGRAVTQAPDPAAALSQVLAGI